MKSLFDWHPLVPPRADARSSLSLQRWADLGAVIFLGLGFLQKLVGLDGGWTRWVPLALGILIFGLPHGAIDHLVALGLGGKPLRPFPLGAVLALYLLAVLAVLGVWVVSPRWAALGFLLMTIYHWGKSDVIFERLAYGCGPDFRRVPGDSVHLLLRGLIPIGLPFLTFPNESIPFLEACLQSFRPGSEIDWTIWRGWLLGLFVVCFLADFGGHLRYLGRPGVRCILIENVVLTVFFCVVPSLVAIGWYFAGWHGLRHVLRLCSYEIPDDAAPHCFRERMMRVGRQALPFTLAALLILGLLLLWMGGRVSSPSAGFAVYLVLISALTVPHLIVVEWMDGRER